MLEGVTITGCNTAAVVVRGPARRQAGALRRAGDADVLLLRAALHSNTADRGACVNARNARVALHGCSFYKNIADNCGAAVFLNASSLLAVGCKFTGNAVDW